MVKPASSSPIGFFELSGSLSSLLTPPSRSLPLRDQQENSVPIQKMPGKSWMGPRPSSVPRSWMNLVACVLIIVAMSRPVSHAIFVTELLSERADGPFLYITFHGGSGSSGINQVREPRTIAGGPCRSHRIREPCTRHDRLRRLLGLP